MNVSQDASTRLMLVGELPSTMTLAAEMIQGSDGNISVGTADCKALDHWCQSLCKMAVVDVTVNMADLVSRLRGENNPAPEPHAAIDQLVGQSVDQVERALILRTLEQCGGNRTAAASMLGISVRTMRNKLRTFLAEETTPPTAVFRT
jgi:DNA-binding NtrC family response regulator